ncbi:Quinone-dependent D-lactate dehydrogenase [Paraburkholderia nemoris]|uniref:D-lactate dehydrogenase n=1 Tax=Paraburkholderia nemoris TaxID=2793076 RepID=UPI00190DD371|nr:MULTISPECIES: D-lactate dehydrogenase [Paraburkholderia]MBK3786566.1 D-lactate dehydrogenase [Paraburkholderia aspalathi]CAE6857866.1 Quinone-dependent D-lactate dehydrogenase [Paraburkholderia nemoris]
MSVARAPLVAAPADAAHTLIAELRTIVGTKHTLTDEGATRRFRTGFRFGAGKALAVVRPGTIVEQWKVLQACVAANVIVITQASNTGLTGGSTPDGDDYDRDIVIVSTSRMKKVYVIDDGKQVVCLPGATLDQLEEMLKPLGREPHSVIGSSCIGASVFGGVCNNSGGALVQRGPAYTEMAAFAQVDATGQLHLVNHLGIQLGETPHDILGRLERGEFSDSDVRHNAGAGSDHHYASHVREIDADTPARFNADPQRLHEASGSAGKLMVFAVRLDTFPIEQNAKVFYIGTNRPDELTDIRRHVLHDFEALPISGEYLHRDAFDIAEKYGKDMFLAIHHLGTSRLPALFGLKSRFDALFDRLGFFPSHFTDRIMQAASRLFPSHLPPRMKEYRNNYEHHLMLKVAAENFEETRAFLASYFANATGGYFECTADEGRKAFLHRFAAAGAAIRYRAVHTREVENIVALDIALRRNDRDWIETLPPDIEKMISIKLYYGHFLCHVFHQDYIVKKGNDCLEVEHKMWTLLDRRGAEYPAEHNVGHLYHAKPQLAAFYRQLDPCNCFNPGIGQASKFAKYREAAV